MCSSKGLPVIADIKLNDIESTNLEAVELLFDGRVRRRDRESRSSGTRRASQGDRQGQEGCERGSYCSST